MVPILKQMSNASSILKDSREEKQPENKQQNSEISLNVNENSKQNLSENLDISMSLMNIKGISDAVL